MHAPSSSISFCNQDFNAYCNSIRKQNSFLSNCHIIPIKGISTETMFYLKMQLLQVKGITEVLEHKNTVSEGQYSIMTTAPSFKHNIELLKSNLNNWVTDIVDKQGINASQFSPPTLCFKGKQSEDESNSNDSYLSASSTTYSYAEYSIDKAPINN